MERFLAIYRACALFFFTCCLYGLVLALFWFGGKKIAGWAFRTNPVTAKYGKVLERAYPGFTTAEIHELLDETWSRPLASERFTGFKERPFSGKYIHVDPRGFRLVKNQGPWPPAPGDDVVFVFGGSTVFGYGLPDDMTIPSFLQERLAKSHPGHAPWVYNFGRGYFAISRERILFEELLVEGYIPKTAVFIDGVNEFTAEPDFARRAAACLERQDWAAEGFKVTGTPSPSPLPPVPAVRAEEAVARYLACRRVLEGVAKAYGVRILFVWQPMPYYEYDTTASPWYVGAPWGFPAAPSGYAMIHERLPELREDFLWAADIQKGLHEPLYVDGIHYGEKLSRLVANAVGDALDKPGV
jgi:hypothetical protein